MNKRGKITISFVMFITLVLTIFILQTEEVTTQSSEEIGQSTKAKIGVGGGGLPPEPLEKPVVIPQNNISLNLSSSQLEEVQSVSPKKYIDPKILEEFNENSEVAVVVEVKDSSGITINREDGIEQQEFKKLKKKEILENKTKFVLSTLSKSDFKLKRKLPLGNGFGGNITKKGFEKLVNNPDVKFVWTDIIAHANLDKSRPLINADDVETAGYNGTYQTACIIDTGVDYTHPALGGCLGADCKVRQGWNYDNDSSIPMDEANHGTLVAGIIASEDSKIRGISPGARLVAIRVCDDTGSFCPSLDIKSAIQDCYAWYNIYNISVVSISLGNGEYPPDCPPTIDTEVNDLKAVGVPVIAVSGNEGYTNGINWPACTPNVTSVGAVYDENLGREPDVGEFLPAFCHDDNANVNTIVCFTNRKAGVLDLLAPGCWINSTKQGGGFYNDCGTSFAAPHVSGTVLLLKQLNKTLTVDEIESTLKNTGVSVGSYKRIDALAALNAIRDKDNDNYYDQAYGGNDCNDNNAAVNPGATEACDDIDNDCDSVIDEGCVEDCNEPGYSQCASSSFEDCSVSLAVDYYNNSNTVRWGVVNDSSDPYVISQYKIAWKNVRAKKVYYGNNVNETCQYGGCDSTKQVSNTGTKVTVTAPGTASAEMILGYNDTPSWACWVWFNSFNPNYGSANPIFVLNCFADSDCASGSYCNKTGTWNQWACVTKYANGISCTQDFQCQSNYCDNDGTGLADDNWCFTPYNTYFDGQENTYCEYSTDNGISDCDERQVNGSITSCTLSGQTYLGDRCTSSCGSEDSNICRSSGFATGCIADAQCNGITAGTGNCTSTCIYDIPPTTTLVSPSNNYLSTTGNIIFNCSAIDDYGLRNMTLYHNISGSWSANETKALTGTSDHKIFTINNIPDKTFFIWNCLTFDNATRSDFGDINLSVNVSYPVTANLTITSLSSLYSNSTLQIFEFIILNNGTATINSIQWQFDTANNNVINSTINISSLSPNEKEFVYLAYNFSSGGTFNVKANATGLSESTAITASLTASVTVNTTSLSDVNKFLIKNSSGSNIAWFGDAGNVVIKGNLEQNSNFQATDNFAFRIRNNANDVLIIENNGSMYIDGTLAENQATINSDTNRNDFRIKDNSSNLVAFVNETGYVFLKGTLTQNGNP